MFIIFLDNIYEINNRLFKIHLAEKGKEVTVVELADQVARDANMFLKPTMYARLEELKDSIHIIVNAKTKSIDENGLVYEDKDGKEYRVDADTVLYAIGNAANTDVVEELRAWDGWEYFFPIGDCTGAGIVRKAIHGAYFAAMDII